MINVCKGTDNRVISILVFVENMATDVLNRRNDYEYIN